MHTGLKILMLLWLCIVGYWLLPLKKPKQPTHELATNTILATQQFCDNGCAEILIKKGNLEIPFALREKYPSIHTNVANVIGSSPFKKSKAALMFSYDFIMDGHVQSVDTTAKEGIIPVFYISEWYPTQYIARFWKLTGIWEVLYLINLNLGLPLILYFILKQRESKGIF
jgi:hypothetical protein